MSYPYNNGCGCASNGNTHHHCPESDYDSCASSEEDQGQCYPLSIKQSCCLSGLDYTPSEDVAVWNGTEWIIETP